MRRFDWIIESLWEGFWLNHWITVGGFLWFVMLCAFLIRGASHNASADGYNNNKLRIFICFTFCVQVFCKLSIGLVLDEVWFIFGKVQFLIIGLGKRNMSDLICQFYTTQRKLSRRFHIVLIWKDKSPWRVHSGVGYMAQVCWESLHHLIKQEQS